MDSEASAITLLAFIFMAIIPMIASYAVPRGRMVLSLTSAAGFLILGIYAYQNNTEEWSMLYGLFMFSMIMVMANVFMAVIMRDKPEEYDTSLDETDPVKADYIALQKDKAETSTKPTKNPVIKKPIKRTLKPTRFTK